MSEPAKPDDLVPKKVRNPFAKVQPKSDAAKPSTTKFFESLHQAIRNQDTLAQPKATEATAKKRKQATLFNVLPGLTMPATTEKKAKSNSEIENCSKPSSSIVATAKPISELFGTSLPQANVSTLATTVEASLYVEVPDQLMEDAKENSPSKAVITKSLKGKEVPEGHGLKALLPANE